LDFGLKGKLALITGAGSQIGFGKAIALDLAREGCDLVVTYNKNAAGAQTTVSDIRSLGHKAMAVKVDVRNGAEVKEMVDETIKQFGKIDILVNNAGGPAAPPKLFIETAASEWDQNIDVNLKGTLLCTHAVLGQMLSRKYGKIINISSMAARTGAPYVCVYESAKAAVIAFTKGLAAEVACLGINVNCVAPGFGMTDLGRGAPAGELEKLLQAIPLKRTTTPEDVSAAVVYLASDVSRDVVGQTLAIDGGTMMY
jgi:3-oxoacyl-[acyl-carrier protein] reductase